MGGGLTSEELDEHKHDEFAHSAERHQRTNDWIRDFQVPVLKDIGKLDTRMTLLERWQQRLIGGFAVLSLLVGAGTLGLIYEFFVVHH